MSGWDGNAFDRWLTTQPDDDECPVCGETLGETENCPECQEYRNQGEIEE